MNRTFVQAGVLLGYSLCATCVFLSSCDTNRFDNIPVDTQIDSNKLGQTRSADSLTILQIGDEKTLASWVADSHGHVILIDFWATWCGPCVQQFPHTVRLANQHKGDGLKVFSVSMDEPEEKHAVRDFLKLHKVEFETLLTPYGIGAEFVNAFAIRGDIPFYQLYDRKGNLRYSFSAEPEGIENCESIDKIDERVRELLAEAE